MIVEPLAVGPAEAAKRLFVSQAHVYRMLRSGELRGSRLGKRWLIRVEEIHRVLDNTQGPEAA